MHVVLAFSSSSTANHLVAGIPAAARAAREVALAISDRQIGERCSIAVPGGWTPTAWCHSELARLAPDLQLSLIDTAAIAGDEDTVLYIRGEALLPAKDVAAVLTKQAISAHGTGQPAFERESNASEQRYFSDLDKAGDAIIASTRKASDGIVSRHVNRHLSQTISRFLLRFPGIAPLHATVAAAVVGVVMGGSLFFGGNTGLIVGALLFQAASILDGVDGEIARATFRASASGAMFDSLTDAATNLAFIGGLTVNLWLQGNEGAASMGAAGLAMLALGLFLIGRRARASDGPFTFDAIKNHVRAGNSRAWRWLTWLAMRDFIAAAGAVLVVIGLAPQALITFAIATAGWLIVTLIVLFRTRGAVGRRGHQGI